MPIKYPVRLTNEFQIIDAENRTVVPELIWKGDAEHHAAQREVGEYIVELMNIKYAERTIADDILESTETIEGSIPTALNGNGHTEIPRKRGRPFGWRKSK